MDAVKIQAFIDALKGGYRWVIPDISSIKRAMIVALAQGTVKVMLGGFPEVPFTGECFYINDKGASLLLSYDSEGRRYVFALTFVKVNIELDDLGTESCLRFMADYDPAKENFCLREHITPKEAAAAA
jgi:hypothetical protein